jgi:hypothetical protein
MFCFLQEKHVPGILNVVLSLTTAEGHILPHCDGVEGHQFARHQLVLAVPQPAAQLRVCDEIHEFVEGEILTFNVSLPHEVINPSAEVRLVLLFDTLHDHILHIPRNLELAMGNLHKNWAGTVAFVEQMNLEMKSSADAVRSEAMRQTAVKNHAWQDCTHEVTWQTTEKDLAEFYEWKKLADGCCECKPPGSPEYKDPKYQAVIRARMKESSIHYEGE